MPEYIVTKREVHCQGYSIDAKTKEEALLKVREGDGELIDSLFEYSHTLDPDTWTVEKVTS